MTGKRTPVPVYRLRDIFAGSRFPESGASLPWKVATPGAVRDPAGQSPDGASTPRSGGGPLRSHAKLTKLSATATTTASPVRRTGVEGAGCRRAPKLRRYCEAPDNLYAVVTDPLAFLVAIHARSRNWEPAVLKRPDHVVAMPEFGLRCRVADLYRATELDPELTKQPRLLRMRSRSGTHAVDHAVSSAVLPGAVFPGSLFPGSSASLPAWEWSVASRR